MIAETSGLGAFIDDALPADVEFILKDQFQELLVRELMSAGLFQAQLQAAEQAGEAQLAGIGSEVLIHGF